MLSYLNNLFYSLGRQYGQEIHYHRASASVVDYDSGRTNTSYTVTRILRAIILPKVISRKFLYDSIYTKATGGLTYGATNDVMSRSVILRKLPFTPSLDDFIIYQNERYKVEKVEELEFRSGFLLVVTRTSNTETRNILHLHVRTSLVLFSGASNE